MKGFPAVDEDLVVLLVVLIGVMIVYLFGVEVLDVDLVGFATCTDLLMGGE